MEYYTRNVCYIVWISSQVLSYPVMKQIKIQKIGVQNIYFMFTLISHIVLYTAEIHTTNEKHVQCVLQC